MDSEWRNLSIRWKQWRASSVLSTTIELEKKKKHCGRWYFQIACLGATLELQLSLWICCYCCVGLIKSLFLTDHQHINESIPSSESYILPPLTIRWTVSPSAVLTNLPKHNQTNCLSVLWRISSRVGKKKNDCHFSSCGGQTLASINKSPRCCVRAIILLSAGGTHTR